MKNIIPSKLNAILTKIRKTILPALRNIIVNVIRLIPSKFRIGLLIALVLALIVGLSCCIHNDNANVEASTYIVDVTNLNVHKNRSADSSVLGVLPIDLEVQVQEEIHANGADWGRLDKIKLSDGTKIKGGWIDLKYTRLPGEVETEPVEPTVAPTEAPTEPPVVTPDPEQGITVMGTVTAGKLNIRKGAGSKYEAFDSYLEGDRVEIQEIVTVDDTEWGRTGKGWIGMGFVRLDGTAPEKPAETESGKTLVSDGSYAILGYGVVDLRELNVRLGPDTEYDKAKTITQGARYAYYEIRDGWVRIEDGWVSTSYFYLEGTTAGDAVTGTVAADDLNIRTGPATIYKSIGTLQTGDPVEIMGQVGDWGYTSAGWINVTNVELNAPTYTTGAGTVTIGLNIRKEPNAESEKVGTYAEGDIISVIEVQEGWGRTDKGWINLKYVSYG